ncbi:unnamed protein product [Paramecium pentaurelia]|uniref:Uncharacterized protein n=1 Tax=Paramecium pentaurelia TaxID=43138 RepID=A0A8S1SVR9_9CILI|nr:unnamed protein product [Paramecium pentaurelia]
MTKVHLNQSISKNLQILEIKFAQQIKIFVNQQCSKQQHHINYYQFQHAYQLTYPLTQYQQFMY